jgi:preprotein translocase subunit SecY
MTEKRLKIIYSFTVSAIFTVIFIAIATVLSELYHPFKSWLAETFTHHWIGKGVLAVIVFLGMRFFYSFFYFHRIPVGLDTRLKQAGLFLNGCQDPLECGGNKRTSRKNAFQGKL